MKFSKGLNIYDIKPLIMSDCLKDEQKTEKWLFRILILN